LLIIISSFFFFFFLSSFSSSSSMVIFSYHKSGPLSWWKNKSFRHFVGLLTWEIGPKQGL
jgi:hypothetical protein